MKGNTTLLTILFFIISFFSAGQATTQIILQLEKFNEPKAVKYFIGDKISFKTYDFPDGWRDGKIESLSDKEKIIYLDDGIVALADITHFRIYNKPSQTIGNMLMQFSAAWFLYGGIAVVADDFDFGWDTAIIGGSAFVGGWLIKKLFHAKKYKINDKNRLRILDISWPDPVDVNN